jgi:hypothetical protein
MFMRKKIGRQGMICGCLLALMLVGSCKRSMESQRDAQDELTKQLGKSAAHEEYRKRYEASLGSPEALYLYARTVEDRDELKKLVDKLTGLHPNFAWGWNIKAYHSELRGDPRAMLQELAKATALEPGSKFLADRNAREKGRMLVFDPGGDAGRAAMRIMGKGIQARLAGKTEGDFCQNLFETLPGESVSHGGLKIKGFYNAAPINDIVYAGVAILNNTASPMEFGYASKTKATCWSGDDKPSYAQERVYWMSLKGHSYTGDNVKIAPGEYGCPHASFPFGKYVRCTVTGIPEREGAAGIYFGIDPK